MFIVSPFHTTKRPDIRRWGHLQKTFWKFLTINRREIALDEQKFKVCLEELRETIVAQCFKMLGNRDDAEDAAQDALGKALSAQANYVPQVGIPFDHWLKRIATNVCLDKLRKRIADRTNSEHDPDKKPDPRQESDINDIFDKAEQDQIMTSLKTCLDERDFWMLTQRIAGLTLNEIAEELPEQWKLKREGVKSRFDGKIKKCLEAAKQMFHINT